MNLILLGAPGAGKGTQALFLTQNLGIPSISTGNMLREAMENHTPLGESVRPYMESGSLVPDELIIRMLQERISKPDCKNGFILDGVPRTLAQAEQMEAIGIEIHHVVLIDVADGDITKRMSGRRVCHGCGATYHIDNNPPKAEGRCDVCGEELIIREDDKPETVQHRLDEYHRKTEPLKNFYRGKGLLRTVCGSASIEEIHREILGVIGAKV